MNKILGLSISTATLHPKNKLFNPAYLLYRSKYCYYCRRSHHMSSFFDWNPHLTIRSHHSSSIFNQKICILWWGHATASPFSVHCFFFIKNLHLTYNIEGERGLMCFAHVLFHSFKGIPHEQWHHTLQATCEHLARFMGASWPLTIQLWHCSPLLDRDI